MSNVDEGFEDVLGIDKSNPVLIILFIPTQDKNSKPLIDARMWLDAGITLLSELFGGATVMTAQGCWFNAETKEIVREEVNLVHSYVSIADAKKIDNFLKLGNFLHRMGAEANQGEIGVVVDQVFHRITNYRKTDAAE